MDIDWGLTQASGVATFVKKLKTESITLLVISALMWACTGEQPEASFRPSPALGELVVSGDAEGSFPLTQNVAGPGYGVGGDKGSIYLARTGDQLTVSQVSFDGLEFFPNADECTLSNEHVAGPGDLVAVTAECVEIRDVRDSATIDLNGQIMVPADLLTPREELPELGGTMAIDGETYKLDGGVFDQGSTSESALAISGPDVELVFSSRLGNFYVSSIDIDGSSTRLDAGECAVEIASVARIDHRQSLAEVTWDCEPVNLQGFGEVSIVGTSIVERITPTS